MFTSKLESQPLISPFESIYDLLTYIVSIF